MLITGGVLLVAFVVIELRVADPLLPPRIVADRNRGASYLSIALAFVSMFGAFLFLTYFLQRSLDFSPLRTGIAFLPMSFGIMLAAGLSNAKLMAITGPRPLIPTGFLIGAGAMLWLAQISPATTYAGGVIGPMLLLGIGLGLVFAPSINTATTGLADADAGVGSAMVNTSQQIGGAVGTAVLSTIFATSVKSYLTSHAPGPQILSAAELHGYGVAFAASAGVLLAGVLISAVLLRSGTLDAGERAVQVAA